MKRIVLLSSTLFLMVAGYAQAQQQDTLKPAKTATPAKTVAPVKTVSAPKQKKDWSKVNIANRPADHFLVQVGYDGWAARPDSIHTKGFSRSLNIYLMFDFPFKTDPRFSVGAGAGIGSSNIFFDKQTVGVASLTGSLTFPDAAATSSNYFKKYKLVTTYLEAPIELRFAADPEHYDHSWKGALGVKVGTLLSVHTKGKNLVNSSGATINNYIEKESSKRYFTGTKLAGTARIGYGHISLFGQFQINNFIKDGVGPSGIHPFSVGITFSGL
ncbi:MAG: outer membrane beta-barrel protein [Bacteroidetes bacterium]|nr:outer membrane beta-barrel protein [Bacteroidota bacterium]